ncbi:Hypothetical predicted protein [Paramuricea clavata]|uniref:DUF5641 domain-containing protein n=1 Tax=Paramuricea clavata TaxID=317549 RepID=A0A7D9EGU6_PARCT|nr:Hypothetical predicted protein [Paramuricea clavata]
MKLDFINFSLICTHKMIQRKLDLGLNGRTNLNNPVYFLYAAGPMKDTGDKIGFHKLRETSPNFLNVSTISDNTDNSKAKKLIGNGILTFKELEDVVLDVEVALNNRPLSYLEDDIELSVLTPATILNINPSRLPELKARHLDEEDLRKRAKILKGCKRAMWRRWSREYVRSLRERHVNARGKQASCPRKGSAVIIADESKNRNTWKLGIVSDLIKGKEK